MHRCRWEAGAHARGTNPAAEVPRPPRIRLARQLDLGALHLARRHDRVVHRHSQDANMVSEGVDIARLAVGVYPTNTLTDLFFRQAVGQRVRDSDSIASRLHIQSRSCGASGARRHPRPGRRGSLAGRMASLLFALRADHAGPRPTRPHPRAPDRVDLPAQPEIQAPRAEPHDPHEPHAERGPMG